MNQYEIALVVSAQLTDEDRAAVVEQVKNLSLIHICTEKIALFETVKEGFFDEWLAKIEEVVDPSDIDYIVLDLSLIHIDVYKRQG